MRGRWAEAEAGLRDLLDGQDDPGMIGRETVPVLARVLVRQGSADASEWLALAARHAATAGRIGVAGSDRRWRTSSRRG